MKILLFVVVLLLLLSACAVVPVAVAPVGAPISAGNDEDGVLLDDAGQAP